MISKAFFDQNTLEDEKSYLKQIYNYVDSIICNIEKLVNIKAKIKYKFSYF